MEETYSFGYWVERRRKALDLTRAELAARVGCAVETIKKIERDERRPSHSMAEILSSALCVPAEECARFLKAARGEQSIDGISLTAQPLQSPRHNLPPPPTPFIGRETELADIAMLLANPDCRLLTLVGPGGIGKSRIALQAAGNLTGADLQGIYLVPLAGINSADALPAAISSALHLEMIGKIVPRLIDYLRDAQRGILLVLDNFEHLLDETELITEILQQAPLVKMLVTSRERLNIQAEWVYPIEGLDCPISDDLDEIARCGAVKLFVQSARSIRANLHPNESMLWDVAQICRMVEGMPLAIELAASWSHILTFPDIVHELEQGIGILNRTARDMPERHQNIRALFHHSWVLLSEEERAVLQKLSVFRGGFDREAAEQVAGAQLGILLSLVDKSLLRMYTHADGSRNYDLHGLVRQYAAEKLLERGAECEAQVQECHLDYFLHLAEQAEVELQRSNSLFWLNCLERNYDNLRAAFYFAAGEGMNQDGTKAQRLLGALWWFWCVRGHVDDACQWAEQSLARPTTNPASRAKATWVAGFLNFYHGNHALARELLEQGVALCRALGPSGLRDLSHALNYLGVEAGSREDAHRAQGMHEESLQIRQQLKDFWGISHSLLNLSGTASFLGDQIRSRAYLEEALAAARVSGEPSRLSLPLAGLGDMAMEQGDTTQAQQYYCQALLICRRFRFIWLSAEILAQVGNIESRLGNPERAARLWGASEGIYRVHGAFEGQLLAAENQIRATRERLGESAFEKAWSMGQVMTLEQAISYALREGSADSDND